jgi:hypothetical protein
VSRIPVFRDGQMIGVLGKIVFPNPDKVRDLVRKVERLEGRLKYYQTRPRHGAETNCTAEDIVAVASKSFGGEVTFGLTGIPGAYIGAHIGGAVGAMNGLTTGAVLAGICYAGFMYDNN